MTLDKSIDRDNIDSPSGLREINPHLRDNSPTELEYNPNEVIVKFKSSVQTADVAILQSNLRATTLETTRKLGTQLWQIQGMTADEAVAAYANDPRVEYIEPNYLRSLAQTPNDPSFGQLWGLNNTGQTGGTSNADIDAPKAWDLATGSADVVVGVIDTGVDYNHPDLATNIWTNPGEVAGDGIDNDGNGYVDDVHGYDFSDGDSDPFDYQGHGTHVSGTIGAVGDNGTGVVGANWSAQIMALKIFPNATDFNIIQAIEYSAEMGVKITNNSWGGGPSSAALEDAIAYAGSQGQLFIAAAGNFSQDNDANPFYPASFDLDNIISVAATDHNDLKAGFSHYGATSVDLGAPGVDVYSTLPGNNYGFLSGTSMASPHVAGVTALLLSQYPDLTAEEVKEVILGSVDPIATLDGLTVSGGRLNAYNALVASTAGSISGTQWNDLNGDGTQDTDEPGLANWTIYLDANNNGELDHDETSTVTDTEGNYDFKFLTSGSYTVAEVPQPGWTQTSSPETYNLIIAENQDIENINFGNQLTNPVSISGRKWNDVDRDGIQNNDEPVLEGWTIYLDANNNGELDDGEQSTVTDANGEYSFDNLPPDTYTVAEVQQPTWTQTSPAIGILGEVFNIDFSDEDGNPDLDGFTIDNTGGAVDGLWHLSTGRGNQPGHSADDSLYFGTGEDDKGGGNYDVGHTAGRITSPVIDLTGISGAELSFNYVLASEGGNPFDRARVLISQDGGVFESIASNTSEWVDPTTDWTNATVDLSAYTGSNIEIRFDFDTIDSTNNNFEGWYVDDIVVTEVGNGKHTLELAPDESATNINFGNAELEPGEIHGYKWNDQNGDGEWNGNESALSGWTIYLDDNQNGELDEDEPSAVTDANGEYSFTELVPGTYTVAEVPQEGWTQTSPAGSDNSIEPDDYSNGTILNTVQPGVTLSAVGSGITNDQVFSQTSTYSSTGTQNFNNSASYWYNDVAEFRADFDASTSSVSIDFISDDSSDIGLLEAYDADGNLLETYTTAVLTTGQSETMTISRSSADIAYILAMGQDGSSFGYLDNLVFSRSDSHSVEVSDGEIVTDVNFGNQQIVPAEIHGIKWNDSDGNGNQDADELGLEGWTIYLDDNQNGQLDVGEESTVTDANGEYAFTNLAAGTYTVAEVQQSGWQQTYPGGSTSSTTLTFDDIANISDYAAIPSNYAGLNWSSDFSYLNSSDYPGTGYENGTVSGDYVAFNAFANPVSISGDVFDFNSAYLTAAWQDDLNVEVSGYFNNVEKYTQTVEIDRNAPTFFDFNFADIDRLDFTSFGGTNGHFALDDATFDLDGSEFYTIELDNGEITTDIDFGNQEQRGTISGSKWHDLDGNGTRDIGEPGLANWTIYLDDNNNGQLDTDETSIITDELGNYSFSLEPGTYTVAEVVEPDWVQTYPVGGTHTVELEAGEDITNTDFGNRPAFNAITGTSGDDVLSGTPIPDDIRSFGGNDRLRGRQDNDTLRGGSDNDSLYGGGGDDDLFGNTNDDIIYGGKGNDNLRGGSGVDKLTGVNILDALPGLGEIDRLQGNADIDTFALGDASKVYYDDGNNANSGLNDYGFILDFTVDTDVIQLSGSSSDYFLATSPAGQPPGTAIFLETGAIDELLGIVRNVPLAQLDLTNSSFSYV